MALLTPPSVMWGCEKKKISPSFHIVFVFKLCMDTNAQIYHLDVLIDLLLKNFGSYLATNVRTTGNKPSRSQIAK
jgi:hypothetical protein